MTKNLGPINVNIPDEYIRKYHENLAHTATPNAETNAPPSFKILDVHADRMYSILNVVRALRQSAEDTCDRVLGFRNEAVTPPPSDLLVSSVDKLECLASEIDAELGRLMNSVIRFERL